MKRHKTIIPAAIRGRYTGNGKTAQCLEVRPDLYTNTLTSVQKDNVLIEISESEEDSVKIECNLNNQSELTMIGGLQAHQHPRSDGICPCINSAAGMGGGQTPIVIRPQFRVRKLTPKECWRLMGFEDHDFENAKTAMNQNIYNGNDRSGSQLYKQAGNSIVVDVLRAIMQELYGAMSYLFEDMEVGSFFSGIGAFEKALSTFDNPSNSNVENEPVESDELRQLGYINDYNGDANRIYDGATVARALKAEAGGGGAKTGWYKIQ